MNNIQELMLVLIDYNYCDYLRKFDYRVAYNKNSKLLRPFVGVLFEVNGVKYFAPLSSPRPKHLTMFNQMDFMKINEGKLGAINFNNMIPLIDGVYQIIDLKKPTKTKEEQKYQELLSHQLDWLNSNRIQMQNRANKLYGNYIKNKISDKMKERCCNFPLLEEKCIEYDK